MGITHINNLPENQMTRTLQDARQTSRERKGSSQRIGGASLAYLISENPGTYDWNGLTDGSTGNPPYGRAEFIVTLTAEQAEVPLADVAMLVYYAADGVNFSEYTRERSFADVSTFTNPEMAYGILPMPGIANGLNQSKWRIWINAYLTSRVAFKLQAVGTDDMAISVQRVE